MDRLENSAHDVGKKTGNSVRDLLFDALGQSKNVYVATKLTPKESHSLNTFSHKITDSFNASNIVELPYDHHITRSFLGTKTAEQLRAFHERLLMTRPDIWDIVMPFQKLGRFRSFVNGRVILFLEPSEKDKEALMRFRQSLRMEERNPKKGKDDFKPHITLAQLSADISDEIIETFIHANNSSVPSISPSYDSLSFHGKSKKEKVSMQIF